MFRGERKVILTCMISIMTTDKLIRNGCPAYLAHIRKLKREWRLELASIPIMREFPNVFLEELFGLSPVREVEVSIEVLPEVHIKVMTKFTADLGN